MHTRVGPEHRHECISKLPPRLLNVCHPKTVQTTHLRQCRLKVLCQVRLHKDLGTTLPLDQDVLQCGRGTRTTTYAR